MKVLTYSAGFIASWIALIEISCALSFLHLYYGHKLQPIALMVFIYLAVDVDGEGLEEVSFCLTM